MKKISLLGATGSIGCNVLDIVRLFPQRFEVVAMAAGNQVQRFAEQIVEFCPQLVSMATPQGASELRRLLPEKYKKSIVVGEKGNSLVASHEDADITISAIVGGAGLIPTLAAIRAGKDIGLANKETLVMAGQLVMAEVLKKGVRLLPVDSEHSAIFQALEAGRREDLQKIILTASGGPFRGRLKKELLQVTREDALNHPNWSMGPKISIDSATLMNKGLEVIEAKWLFDVEVDDIEVVVHPQSIIHSLVEYRDGSVLAQMGVPDMKIPIGYALSYPERMDLQLPSLHLSDCGRLDFHEPDHDCFPALGLAFEAIKRGGTLPAILNAANEVAVDAFLNGKITFLQITETVAETMDIVEAEKLESLEDVLQADSLARSKAREVVERS